MDWGSTLVGLAGVGVAALTVWLNFRERGSGHRQTIYEKQLQAYLALSRAAWSFVKKALPLLPEERALFTEKRRLKFQTETNQEKDLLESTALDSVLLFPQDVTGKCFDLLNLIADLGSSRDLSTITPNPNRDVQTALFKLFVAMQTALGIEPLSQEILSVVGARSQME